MPDALSASLPFITRSQLEFAAGAALKLDLVLVASSSEKVELRGFTKQGPFVFVVEPVGDSSVEEFSFAIPDIPVSVSCLVNPTAQAATYDHATLHLDLNGNRLVMLAQGIISNIDAIAWPHQLPTTGPQLNGAIERVFLGNGTVGANFSSFVPSNQEWDVLSIAATLACDANAANRTLSFLFETGIGFGLQRTSGTSITAGQTVEVTALPGGTTQVIVANSQHEVALPAVVQLAPSAVFKVNINNKQAGDQLIDVTLVIRRRFGLYTD